MTREDREAIVAKEYKNKSAGEIATETGMSKTEVLRIARSMKLQHSRECQERLLLKRRNGLDMCRQRWSRQEMKQAMSEKMKNIWKKEYMREHYGLTRKTKLRLGKISKRAYKAKWYLMQYGYIETTEPYLLWFDENTKREKLRYGENYYTKKYGIKFATATSK